MRREQLRRGDFFKSTGVTAVASVQLLFKFAPAQLNLIGVDDDHVIAGVEVRRKRRFVLSA